MNWKTVLQLVRIDMKSSRLLRGKKLAKYNVRRNQIIRYLEYGAAIAIGIIAGFLTLLVYNSLAGEPNFQSLFNVGFTNFQYDATNPTQRSQLHAPSTILATSNLARTHSGRHPCRPTRLTYARHSRHCTSYPYSRRIHRTNSFHHRCNTSDVCCSSYGNRNHRDPRCR